MRVNAIRYLLTQGSWDGKVWRPLMWGNDLRIIYYWKRKRLHEAFKVIGSVKRAMKLV